MMPDETLFRNEWISLRIRNGWFSYAHMEKGDGFSKNRPWQR